MISGESIRSSRAGALALLVLLGTAACREAVAPRAGTAEGGGEGALIIAVSSDITGFNQLTSGATRLNQDVLDLLFLHLLEERDDFTRHPPTFGPALAESYTISPTGLEVELQLRDDVLWSDGRPVTAEDVAWTWEAQTDEEIAWSYAQSKEEIESVEAISASRVRFRFRRRYRSQLADLNEGVILPRHAWQELPFSRWRQSARWFQDHLVVNGPYRLESWQPQQQIVLRRNERYFRQDRPLIETVVFRVIPDPANRLQQLLGGSVGLVDHLAPGDSQRVAAGDRTRLLSFWPRQYSFICWNTARPLFRDPSIRQALTMAIDRQEIVDTLWSGRARVASSPIISSVWAHNSDPGPWPFDPRRAAEILRSKGWRDSDGDGVVDQAGEPFSFELSTNTGNRLRADAAVMIQHQLSRVGIDARVRLIEFNRLVEMNETHEFDATLGAWGVDTTLDLEYAFHSSAIDDGYNYGSYRNGEVDRLIEEAKRQDDLEVMRGLLHRLQEVLHQDQPYTFLWEPQRLVGVTRRLQGARPNALSTYSRLEEWRLSSL